MATKYQDWLAANIVADEKSVTYRALSRAVKVHAHKAKQMLYEFHKTQNARRPSSIHATYLVAGVRKPPAQTNGGPHATQKDGDDINMTDGSFPASSMPETDIADAEDVRVTTITLAKEKDLETVKAQFESITSVFVYALSPGDLVDLQVLVECNKTLLTNPAGDDPLESWKTYGTIHNPNARRRTTHAPVMPIPAAPDTKPLQTSKPEGPPASSTTSKGSTQPSNATQNSTKKPPTAKRESSSLFTSFGKTAASNAKLKLNTPADGASDDDQEHNDAMDEDGPNPEQVAQQRAKAEAAAKEKAAKDAKLRAMMEQQDDEEDEADGPKDDDEEMREAWSESEPEPESARVDTADNSQAEAETNQQQQQPPQQEAVVTSSDGRRRGRRQVTRKKRTVDADGMLETREELVWESFSEDDAPAKATAAKTAKSEVAPAAAGKKPTAATKKAQGNIMSFFKK